jgi:hypothetical protein
MSQGDSKHGPRIEDERKAGVHDGRCVHVLEMKKRTLTLLDLNLRRPQALEVSLNNQHCRKLSLLTHRNVVFAGTSIEIATRSKGTLMNWHWAYATLHWARAGRSPIAQSRSAQTEPSMMCIPGTAYLCVSSCEGAITVTPQKTHPFRHIGAFLIDPCAHLEQFIAPNCKGRRKKEEKAFACARTV